MPHPQSPHCPSLADVSSSLGSIQPTKDSSCAPSPIHSRLSLSLASARPYGSQMNTAMATAFPETVPSKEQQQHLPQTFMGVDDPSSLQWTTQYDFPTSRIDQNGLSYPPSAQYTPETQSLGDFVPNGLPFTTNYSLMYPVLNPDPTCPRSYVNGLGLTSSMGTMNMSESYPPSAYVIEPPKSHDTIDLADQTNASQLLLLNNDYEQQYASNIKVEDIKVEECGDYGTPYSSAPGTRCSTPQDKLPAMSSRDLKHEGHDETTIDKEQPYAQLIYRALMEAPNHTMILRDIYEWFKKNTDKAADKETKGWQNSIRHNLSMNGAFEKVDQLCEDAKKGFMWRLTDEARREGVKSTTRYRSKQPNKRGHRSQQPLPQRQASGAKGGQAAKRSAKLRQSQRRNGGYAYRSDPYMHRSMLTTYDHSGFDPCIDIPMPYPSSPYYNSEVDFGHPSSQDEFDSSFVAPNLDTHPYAASPLSQEPLCVDTAYILHQDPTEPLFYDTDNSPSPTESEPRTPDSQEDCYIGAEPLEDTSIYWDICDTYQE